MMEKDLSNLSPEEVLDRLMVAAKMMAVWEERKLYTAVALPRLPDNLRLLQSQLMDGIEKQQAGYAAILAKLKEETLRRMKGGN